MSRKAFKGMRCKHHTKKDRKTDISDGNNKKLEKGNWKGRRGIDNLVFHLK